MLHTAPMTQEGQGADRADQEALDDQGVHGVQGDHHGEAMDHKVIIQGAAEGRDIHRVIVLELVLNPVVDQSSRPPKTAFPARLTKML